MLATYNGVKRKRKTNSWVTLDYSCYWEQDEIWSQIKTSPDIIIELHSSGTHKKACPQHAEHAPHHMSNDASSLIIAHVLPREEQSYPTGASLIEQKQSS